MVLFVDSHGAHDVTTKGDASHLVKAVSLDGVGRNITVRTGSRDFCADDMAHLTA